MIDVFPSELPIAKTLPLLIGGGNLNNLANIMTPMSSRRCPTGSSSGLIFNGKDPEEMARTVAQSARAIQHKLNGQCRHVLVTCCNLGNWYDSCNLPEKEAGIAVVCG